VGFLDTTSYVERVFGIKVNDRVGHYFQTKKGVRQGDPLLPTIFNIIVDVLPMLIARAKDNNIFKV
jgi:hypothetical protein